MAAHMKWKQELQAFCKANMAQVQRLTYELCAIPAPTGSEGRRAQFCLFLPAGPWCGGVSGRGGQRGVSLCV